jgi:hypothetical protein
MGGMARLVSVGEGFGRACIMWWRGGMAGLVCLRRFGRACIRQWKGGMARLVSVGEGFALREKG